ncbi:DUF5064 family protein [Pseudomonas mangiferae]|uniref:DUF5064 family protein n=1 Tax=Pseudomonas mangiferae TaxID=2593654 RepID=A0A553H249_9PSED|nr:DUF5064 family protein [Pseudomonas mangiferae]TRX75806.1 DUF5064 family protein [Pseudomonas mangiferae]
MFQPGHLHRTNLPGLHEKSSYTLDLYYDVRNDPKEGVMLHFRMVGNLDGRVFEEEFELHRDTAFNFASMATRIASKHGLHPHLGPILRDHQDYDAMFQDIREKLHVQSGEPVNLDHLLKDGF